MAEHQDVMLRLGTWCGQGLGDKVWGFPLPRWPASCARSATLLSIPLMGQASITIFGIPIPSDAPTFLVVLAVHVAAGLSCVITGIVAMLSRKGAGPHPRFGSFYYWGLGVVAITMAALAAMRWAQDYHLFILGVLSFAAAFVGRQAAPSRSSGRIRTHVIAMGSSYILLLTAFYVDNGKFLPFWRSLPSLAYWLLPLLIGVPLILRVLRYHPLVRAEGRTERAGPSQGA